MWLALSLAAALLQAGQFAVVKGRTRHLPPIVVVFWAQAVGCGAWAAWALVRRVPVAVPASEWRWIALATALAVGMTYLLARGSARGDISIVGPILALSPMFAIVPDWLVSGTLPRGLGWFGIALSIAGAMSVSAGDGTLTARRLLAREDALCALGAAILLGVLSAVDRRNASALGVSTYLLAVYAAMTLVAGLLIALTARRAFVVSLTRVDLAVLAAHAVLAVAGTGMQTTALTLAPAAYVNSVRRASSLFSVLIGRALFREPALAGRLAGAALMVAGAACLLFAR